MKALLFDFGGTLDSDGVTWLARFRPIYKEVGVTAAPEAFDRAFYDSDDNLPARFDLSRLSFEETVSLQVRCVLEELAPERLSLSGRIAGTFVEDSRRHLRRNRLMLERLARRFKLGIVSNFYGNLGSVLESEGLSGLFAAVADSKAVGVEKPAAGLFLSALERLGASPADSLMVGDSVPRDMRGAEGLGMRHALLNAPSAAACCPSAWRLSSLPELEALLS